MLNLGRLTHYLRQTDSIESPPFTKGSDLTDNVESAHFTKVADLTDSVQSAPFTK